MSPPPGMLINENMKYRIPCSFVLFPFQSYSVVSAGTYFPIKKIQINVHVWGKKNALSTQYKYMMLSGIEMSQGSRNGSRWRLWGPRYLRKMCAFPDTTGSWHKMLHCPVIIISAVCVPHLALGDKLGLTELERSNLSVLLKNKTGVHCMVRRGGQVFRSKTEDSCHNWEVKQVSNSERNKIYRLIYFVFSSLQWELWVYS